MVGHRKFLNSIEQNVFSPVYLFYGTEKYLIEELVLSLLKGFLKENVDYGFEKVDGTATDLDSVLERFGENNLFAEKTVVRIDEAPYLRPPGKKEVLTSDSSDEKDKNKKAAGLIENFCNHFEKVVPKSLLIFTSSAVDRRKKLYKIIEAHGQVVECSPLKGDVLAAWINNKVKETGKKIDRQALESLLLAGSQDLYYLENEIYKYAAYAGNEELITGSMVEMLFTGDLQGDVFKLADALAEKKVNKAHNLLWMLLGRREKPLMLFFMLTRHFRMLLQAKSLIEEGVTAGQLSQTLGVQTFVARKLYEQSAFYELQNLENILILLQKTDLKIKTGILDAEEALKLLIAKIDYLQKNINAG